MKFVVVQVSTSDFAVTLHARDSEGQPNIAPQRLGLLHVWHTMLYGTLGTAIIIILIEGTSKVREQVPIRNSCLLNGHCLRTRGPVLSLTVTFAT